MTITATILTSAAIAAVVSSLFTLIAQWLERRERRKERIFSMALDVAKARTEFIWAMAKESRKSAQFEDQVFLAAGYYPWLTHLYHHGKLPEDAEKMAQAQREKYGILKSDPAGSE